MRALVVSIWVFINLVFFGMCGYMYLLWSQYWMYMEKQSTTTTSTYDQQIYYYNRGYLPNDIINRTISNNTDFNNKTRTKGTLKENTTFTFIKNSKPRFPNVQENDFELDTKKFMCLKEDTLNVCQKKSLEFKDKLLKELRRVLTDESNILKTGTENVYNVQYKGTRGNFMEKSAKELLCEFKKTSLNTLKKSDVKSGTHIREFLPRKELLEGKSYNSCAIIASAGSLKGSNLGKIIDSHDLVLRFNHAPTKGYENDVGKKTTIRILNSQVISKNEFKFLSSNIYRNITILAWDPSNYSSSLDEWFEKPEFNLFPNYIEYRKINNNKLSKMYILNPQSLWNLWDFLQSNSPSRLRRNPPSSGFLGLRVLLPHCNFVDMFEYVPSVRVSKRCHYYDPEDNPACTFGVWHPLAAEKLLTYHMNQADERNTFQNGFVRISGFGNLHC